MIRQPLKMLMRRALVVAVGYVLVLQGALAGFATASVVAQIAGGEAGFVVCHGTLDGGRGPGGANPAEGVPCAHCALATATQVILPETAAFHRVAVGQTRVIANRISCRTVSSFGPRAGPARAPPHFA